NIAKYCGASLPAFIAASDEYNTHLYPNNGGPNGASQLHDWTILFQNAWGGKPGVMTEYQSILYNNVAKDDQSNAYWQLCALLSGFSDFGVVANYEWELYDYQGFGTSTGLFKSSAADPYPVATALKALYPVAADTGPDARSFTPADLGVTVSGLPIGSNPYNGGHY